MLIKNKIIQFIRKEPSFLILGAQKAGTSALFQLLKQHPLINSNVPKEINFFNLEYNYEKGINWYENHFYNFFSLNKKLSFEASPGYLYFPEVPNRIHKHYKNKKLKFIISLRDPVDRAYSAWNMYNQMHESGISAEFSKNMYRSKLLQEFNGFYFGITPPSFNFSIDYELKNINKVLHPSIIRQGIYYDQIKRYFKLFDRSRFYILSDYDLKNKTQKVLNEIFDFLEIPSIRYSSEILRKKYHARQYKAKMNNECYKKLKMFYKPYDKKLAILLNNKYYWM